MNILSQRSSSSRRRHRGRSPKSLLLLLVMAGILYWIEQQRPDPDAAARGRYEGTCLKVIDGDTIDVRADSGETFRIRLLGIDCMDTHEQEKINEQARRLDRTKSEVVRLGEKATSRVRALIERKPIAWEVPEGTPLFDPHDRLLAYVELVDGTDLGEWLLREGLAETRRDRHPRAARYRSAAAAALAW
ncbi:MAG TPA: thermonuclease family protein [Kiritimatiellia bacterium]|nr:thermonuclease family protein [Kiritimatiellia bacterium]HMP00298.1 thermonuclease family protein [Kiritimatiellia bacterium]HMP97633.1 thermonuclease family protein [Kiritimatiellia bacterium]